MREFDDVSHAYGKGARALFKPFSNSLEDVHFSTLAQSRRAA